MKKETPIQAKKKVPPLKAEGIEWVDCQEVHAQPKSLFRLWMAANVNIATLGTGAIATTLLGLPLWKAILAIIASSLLGSLTLGFFSTYGVRYDVPMIAISERWFGSTGNRVFSLVAFLSGTGWFAVNTAVCAYALERSLPIHPVLAIFLLSLAQTLIASVGNKLILKAENACYIILLSLFTVITAYCLLSLPTGSYLAPNPGSRGEIPGAWILMINIGLSNFNGWLPFAADYSRGMGQTQKNRSIEKEVFWYAFLGSFFSTSWVEILGAFLGKIIRSENPTDLLFTLLPSSLHLLLAAAILIGTISANMINLYSTGLCLLGTGIRIPFYQASLFVGITGLGAALFGYRHFYQRFEEFLFLLDFLVLPRMAILAITHLRTRTSRIPLLKSGTIGFLCWLLGVIVSIPWIRQEPLFIGGMAATYPQLGDLSFLLGCTVSSLSYWIFTKPVQELAPPTEVSPLASLNNRPTPGPQLRFVEESCTLRDNGSSLPDTE
ncbi:cytosine permease [Candidatus Methylacidiphilum infernorum]|uniref:Cytosine permease n=1 Tax=Candidatus Methylacidiphilum infernorum TaxID=511746 RepID=A0ABX7PXX3_9BACT|nr:cytosine permease [Candidatus Methylacidiphilum infernorum]QSR87670.1 cytosine permease [Candidatus Methylacidiphilum infernorum]